MASILYGSALEVESDAGMRPAGPDCSFKEWHTADGRECCCSGAGILRGYDT